MRTSRIIKKKLYKFYKSVWFYPSVVFFLLLTLSLLRIHGSSIGIYHTQLYGESIRDKNLLYGSPKSVRSDEWLFITQMTVAQKEAGYPRINTNIGNGKDMSVLTDAPYKEWSTIFRPQNLLFLAIPFEIAFAFKWWFLLSMLLISSYFFTLRILKNKTISILLSLGFSFSPFIFWWYQTATIAPLFLGFFIILCSIRIINQENIFNLRKLYSNIIYSVILAYLLVAFTLVMYPPFQIPVAFSTLVFLIGYLLNKKYNFKIIINRLLPVFATSVIIASLVVGAFLITRIDVIRTINNTDYPGVRVIHSGGLSPYYMTTSFVQPQLQRSAYAAKYFTNQSAASNFILLAPFLILPALLLLNKKILLKKGIDFILVTLIVGILMLLSWSYIPGLDFIFKPFLFEKVPHLRMLLGYGFIGYLFTTYFMSVFIKERFSKINQQAIIPVYILFVSVCMLAGILYTEGKWPDFINPDIFLYASGGIIVLIVFLILIRNYLLASAAFIVFNLLSVFHIHPLYRGLSIINNDVSIKIKELSSTNERWGVVDDILFENYGFINNRRSFTGIQFYPDNGFWVKYAPGSDYRKIYNRYAHVQLTSRDIHNPIELLGSDQFQVKLSCDPIVIDNVDFILSIDKKVHLQCFSFIDEVKYPNKTFYFYKTNK